jgi:hypothetical protein
MRPNARLRVSWRPGTARAVGFDYVRASSDSAPHYTLV